MLTSATILGLLAAAQLSAAQPQSIDGLHGLGTVFHHESASERAGHGYHILVGLPADYDATEERRYPVVYLLDGGALFPMIRAYQRYLVFDGETPEIILVGISYGTDDWQQGNNRSHDYTAPSNEREYFGGAPDFLAFLDAELLPAIEATYRADPDERVLFGQSIGGQFVLFTAQSRPDLFRGYIASNPALHRNLSFFLEQVPEESVRQSRLFVASGSEDEPQFREPALAWMRHWTRQPDLPWGLRTVTLDGHSHMSAPPAAFREGMRWLFSGKEEAFSTD